MLLIGSFLVLLIVSFLLVMPEFMTNSYYDLRYRWSHLPTQTASSVDPTIFKKFGPMDSGGKYNYGSQINFLYESRYDQLTQAYYYRLANTGQNPFCVASEGLAFLTGDVKIRLSPGETKYLVLKDRRPPNLYSYRLHFYESCGWFSYSGGSLELTAPLE